MRVRVRAFRGTDSLNPGFLQPLSDFRVIYGLTMPDVAAIEPLHGLTFALLHLTCMRLLAQCVPRHLEATALTIYGTVGIGIAAALLTLACGPIFERFGAHGFWAMAALCAAALPLALTLREPMAGSR